MMRVKIAKERYDFSDFAAAAINATYKTREPGGVERCIEALNHLKSLSFSFEDTQFSESVSKLETLRRHRNPNISKEAHALFDSWMKTLYAHGRDDSSISETKNDLKPLSLKRSRVTSEDATSKKPRGAVTCVGSSMKKIELERSVITTALPHHSRQNVKDADGKVTTKTLIPPPRRDSARKNVPQTQQTEPVKDSTNPKSAALKTTTEKEMKSKKVEEMVELFESAKKAADVANAKGVLLGQQEAYRCVDALSLLMRVNITPKPKEPRRMMERLEGLTKHKDRKICSAASTLLHLWRQRIREQEWQDSATKMFPNNSHKGSTKARGN